MNRQEVFDKVCDHLVKQKQRAYVPGSGCQYRAGKLKCAIGALIPDEDYREEMDGRGCTLSEACEMVPVLRAFIKRKGNKGFLDLLQFSHDMASGTGREKGRKMAEQLTDLAKEYRLNPAKAKALEKVNWKG